MELGTELAIRAVMQGLFQSDAISAEQVRAVMSALRHAANDAMDRRDAMAAKELIALGKGIQLDTAVAPHPHTADT